MKKWPLLLITSILCICPLSWGANDNLSWPLLIETVEQNPLSYKIINNVLFNFEDFLNETLKLKTHTCQYTSIRKSKIFNYSDTGACIYRLLLDSIYSKDPQNSVYIWAKTDKNKTIQLKLDWRPQLNNVLEVFSQIDDMVFEKEKREKQNHWLGKFYGKIFKIDFENRGFGSQTSLMGQISIKAKSSPETINNLLSLIFEQPPENIQVSGISVDFTPNGRLKGYMNQKINIKVWRSDELELTHFQLTTNLNLLDPSRTFILKSSEIRIQNETP